MKQLKFALIGAGQRGADCYAPYALKFPQEVAFTCVAEPDDMRRTQFAKAHGIAENMQFTSWEHLFRAKPELDGVIIATQDNQHLEPAIAAFKEGYHVLLEKPMAETLEKTKEIVAAAEEANKILVVCHVLRYTPFYVEMKKVLESGVIGDIQAVHHIENIGNWHFGHSFVRGHWNNAAESTPMIVAKCCHDMDILNFLVGKKCLKISSFGGLYYFKKENAPEGAAERCESCQHNKTCQFSAFQYLSVREPMPMFREIVSKAAENGEFLADLAKSQYSQCVYSCENDVCDRQTVSIEYEGGATVSFTASAFTADTSRQTKIMGTKGEIEGKIEDDVFYVRDFASGNETAHYVNTPKTMHAGGDEKIMAGFCEALRNPEEGLKKYSAAMSLQGHEMAFAAEQARVCGCVVEL